MNVDHFLSEDLPKAQLEGICIIDCFIRMHHGFRTGDYGKAKIAAEDISRSFAELEKLNNRKRVDDEFQSLIEKIKSRKSDHIITMIKSTEFGKGS